jgi:hypothetical protein
MLAPENAEARQGMSAGDGLDASPWYGPRMIVRAEEPADFAAYRTDVVHPTAFAAFL